MAFVHDPLHTDNECKVRIYDQIINMIKNGVDFDAKSLYPSEDLQHNISATTQIGMVQIDHQVHNKEDQFHRSITDQERWTRGGAFLEDIQSGNIFEFCARWLHFGRVLDLIDDTNEYLMSLNIMNSNFFRGDIRPIMCNVYGNGERPMIRNISNEENKMRNMICVVNNKSLSKDDYNKAVNNSHTNTIL